MANIASSKKDVRRSAERAHRNRSVKSAVKTKITKFRRAADAGEPVEEFAAVAVSALDRAASKGVVHPNNAARRKSRLVRRLNAVTAVAAEETKPAPKAASRRRAAASAAPPTRAAKTTRIASPRASTKKG